MFAMANALLDWIDEKERERDWNDADLARQIGVYQSTITGIRNGDKSPGLKTLKGLAKVFGVSVDFLVGLQAGRLPAAERNPTVAEILEILRGLPPDEQLDVLYTVLGKREKLRNTGRSPSRTQEAEG